MKMEITAMRKIKAKKKYHVGYAPGTYDLLHEGHMEHLGVFLV